MARALSTVILAFSTCLWSLFKVHRSYVLCASLETASRLVKRWKLFRQTESIELISWHIASSDDCSRAFESITCQFEQSDKFCCIIQVSFNHLLLKGSQPVAIKHYRCLIPMQTLGIVYMPHAPRPGLMSQCNRQLLLLPRHTLRPDQTLQYNK